MFSNRNIFVLLLAARSGLPFPTRLLNDSYGSLLRQSYNSKLMNLRCKWDSVLYSCKICDVLMVVSSNLVMILR
jgi:hypothetical protein